jgi:hypothetical protein
LSLIGSVQRCGFYNTHDKPLVFFAVTAGTIKVLVLSVDLCRRAIIVIGILLVSELAHSEEEADPA